MERSAITQQEAKAIDDFFAAAENLRTLGIIRSDKYLGDIAEFLCSRHLNLCLAQSGRQPGHDGLIGDKRIQVKYHGGTSTTINCGNPEQYDKLLVVLGPNSVHRASPGTGFIIRQLASETVRQRSSHSDGQRRYTRAQLLADSMVVYGNDV